MWCRTPLDFDPGTVLATIMLCMIPHAVIRLVANVAILLVAIRVLGPSIMKVCGTLLVLLLGILTMVVLVTVGRARSSVLSLVGVIRNFPHPTSLPIWLMTEMRLLVLSIVMLLARS